MREHKGAVTANAPVIALGDYFCSHLAVSELIELQMSSFTALEGQPKRNLKSDGAPPPAARTFFLQYPSGLDLWHWQQLSKPSRSARTAFSSMTAPPLYGLTAHGWDSGTPSPALATCSSGDLVFMVLTSQSLYLHTMSRAEAPFVTAPCRSVLSSSPSTCPALTAPSSFLRASALPYASVVRPIKPGSYASFTQPCLCMLPLPWYSCLNHFHLTPSSRRRRSYEEFHHINSAKV